MMRINEIFYSLQGEGHNTGEAAIFVRFSGCDLRCPFCDTVHQSGREMDMDEVIAELRRYPSRTVILTGGEPTLQLTRQMIERLHDEGYRICVESNGRHRLPGRVDWLTVSPKTGTDVEAEDIDELKVVFTGEDTNLDRYFEIPAREYRLQPCDTGNSEVNMRITAQAVEYVKADPRWRLSLQTHKLISIP